MLAGELRLAGLDVVIVDRLEEPSGESRGLGFTPRTMEVFDQRGLLSRFGTIVTSAYGHFGGIPVDFGVLDGAHFSVKDVPQYRTEAVLGDWLAELGVQVLRGRDLITLVDDGDGVTIEVNGPDGVERMRAQYLVGCDGGRSTVRKLGGFPFPGTSSTMEMFLADVTDCEIRPRPIGESVAGGMAMSAPIGTAVHRIIVCELGTAPKKRTGPPAFDEVAAAWGRLTGQDISDATPLWTGAFGNAARQAAQYRRGRLLLAGDAAHIHLPAGGQGMNTGIQDAVNLGWKLAAVASGSAPGELLDSYHTERHPIGARVLTNTQAQGLLYLSGSEMQPLREVFRELVEYREVGRHLAGMISGLDIRYDVGTGDHPLLGSRIPHQDLITDAGATSTTALLHSARGVLLGFSGDPALRCAARGWTGRVDVVNASRPELAPGSGLSGTDAVLVRPDGHVVWASHGAGDLTAALRQWFGPPAGSGTGEIRPDEERQWQTRSLTA
jgi:bifunctional hydroxylase/dehydrase